MVGDSDVVVPPDLEELDVFGTERWQPHCRELDKILQRFGARRPLLTHAGPDESRRRPRKLRRTRSVSEKHREISEGMAEDHVAGTIVVIIKDGWPAVAKDGQVFHLCSLGEGQRISGDLSEDKNGSVPTADEDVHQSICIVIHCAWCSVRMPRGQHDGHCWVAEGASAVVAGGAIRGRGR